MQPQTLTRGLGPSPVRLDPPTWHEIRSCKERLCLSVTCLNCFLVKVWFSDIMRKPLLLAKT